MIKSATYGATVDGDLCMKMVKILDVDKAPAFMKKNKLPLASYDECRMVLSDIWHNGFAETINTNVMNIYKKNGFTVTECGIGWKIA